MAILLLALTLLIAIVDWIAVGRQVARPDDPAPRRVERFAKPAALVALGGAAAALAVDQHPSAVLGVAVFAALAFSLAGDVFLLPPDRKVLGQDNFVVGLGAFLVAHLAYLVAFVSIRSHGGAAISEVVTGLVLMAAAFAGVGRRVLAGARAEDPALAGPVLAYLIVISLMVVGAWWTGDLRIIVGAMLFAFSDAVIGWTKFVRDDRRGPVTVIVTYHAAQMLLVLGLLRR